MHRQKERTDMMYVSTKLQYLLIVCALLVEVSLVPCSPLLES